jgi:hypothetical protein
MSREQFTAALVACLLWPGLALAAIAPGPDAFGYTVASTPNFSFLQITSGGTRVLRLVDDAAATNINIGFTFNFYGSDYTAVSFNVNGLMTFGGASIGWSNVDLTTTSPTDNLPSIAVLWDDWQTLPVGTDGVYYQATGTAGTRQFIVQWNKLEAVNGDGTNKVTFEARLFEGSNRILFSYFDTAISDETTLPPDAARSGVGATVGIRDINGQTSNRNLQWSYNQAMITNGLNLLFAPPNRPPIANNDIATTAENTPVIINVLANDNDPAGNPLSLVSVSQGANGAVTTNANGTVTYSPATDFLGVNLFTYTISDGQGGSATGMVSVTVTPSLKIKSIARQFSGNVLILFQGKPGSNYVMEGSIDFLSWSNLGNLSEGSPGAFQFADTGTAGVDKRFYRVLAP